MEKLKMFKKMMNYGREEKGKGEDWGPGEDMKPQTQNHWLEKGHSWEVPWPDEEVWCIGGKRRPVSWTGAATIGCFRTVTGSNLSNDFT